MDSIAIDTIEEIQLLHDSGVAVSIKQHVREAAEANDVAFEGLYKAVRRNSAYESIRSREHGNRLLSDLEEALTVSSFITMDRMKRPLTRPGALAMMATMWKRTFSAQHLRGLLQRNKKFVRIKQGKVVTKGRTDPNNIRELEWFCDQFELMRRTTRSPRRTCSTSMRYVFPYREMAFRPSTSSLATIEAVATLP